ncbi:uncharacterized protein HMPREF1541_08016 [Cyphellophora europaea CBS 101466]|uniref:Uncharacterized protein n=1 Tax=Cyphellophora europaea (strain CBS 101466) TaxID=1220924 RepID=W2RMV2_CYPE1|nr:uncharacterized protein HMPREF1541_08016 [Cyphellophora europaea CBS 101466]ETN37028.1 hypothetical protein HMPREF1541_08016 [Cyphellophora europaea CBS 101466]
MLRRKPTAITITSDDIADFEQKLAERIAYQKFLKTGEDPNGWFRKAQPGDPDFAIQQQREAEQRNAQTVVDPNDELKPLPGDKARIVRSREERIIGASGTGNQTGNAR